MLGPFGVSGRSETDSHCNGGEAVTGVTYNTITYLLSMTVSAVAATCQHLASRGTHLRIRAPDSHVTVYFADRRPLS